MLFNKRKTKQNPWFLLHGWAAVCDALSTEHYHHIAPNSPFLHFQAPLSPQPQPQMGRATEAPSPPQASALPPSCERKPGGPETVPGSDPVDAVPQLGQTSGRGRGGAGPQGEPRGLSPRGATLRWESRDAGRGMAQGGRATEAGRRRWGSAAERGYRRRPVTPSVTPGAFLPLPLASPAPPSLPSAHLPERSSRAAAAAASSAVMSAPAGSPHPAASARIPPKFGGAAASGPTASTDPSPAPHQQNGEAGEAPGLVSAGRPARPGRGGAAGSTGCPAGRGARVGSGAR